MLAGTSTQRTTVASISSAIPTPKPTCWISAIWPLANPTKTAMMISAAPVITLAVVATAYATASSFSPVRR